MPEEAHSAPAWAWIVWIACALLPLLAYVDLVPNHEGSILRALSIATALYGGLLFYMHGGSQITAAGLYALAVAIFSGFAGIAWSGTIGAIEGPYLTAAVWVDLWTLVGMHLLFWRTWRTPQPLRFEGSGPAVIGLAGGLAVSAALLLGESGGVGVTQLATGSLSLAIISLALIRTDPRRTVFLGILTAGLVLAFGVTVFTGFGRLMLVSLGLTYFVIVSGWQRRRWIKLGVLLLVAPSLTVLIQMREGMRTRSGIGLDGLASVVNPLRDLGLVREVLAQGAMGQGYGSTFVAAATCWVPRSLWPGKPVGFGSVLTEYFQPELVRVGHSMAAHSSGEWLYNFGMPGLLLMVLALGFGLRALDNRLLSVGGGELTVRKFVIVASLVILASEIPTLMWVGTFTYASRVLQKLGAVAVVGVLAAVLSPLLRGRERVRPGVNPVPKPDVARRSPGGRGQAWTPPRKR